MPLDLAVKDRIAVLTINRPEVMNAMDPETYRGLSEAWIEVRENPEIWAAVITGANNAARDPEKQAFASGGAARASGIGGILVSARFQMWTACKSRGPRPRGVPVTEGCTA